VNVASPDPQTNKEFMRLLRKSLCVKLGLPAPEWLLEIGAFFKRTETELLIKSRRVVPERLLQAGYLMKFPKLEAALADLAKG
jgi:NAD dependent epimerase/dehydratase family enzyme